MTTYPKINAPFKRYTSGPEKGKLIVGDWSVPEFEYLADNQWEFTEKVDGTNIRVVVHRVDDNVSVLFFGRTDNADIPEPLLAHLERTFDREFVGAALFGDWTVGQLQNTTSTVVLYGEGYGPKIQGGGKYRDDVSFVLFDVKFGPWWLSRDNVIDIAGKLEIDSVPVIGRGTLNDAFELVRNGLVSEWGDFEAEGVVCRTTVPLFNNKGERITTKVKSVDFKAVDFR